MTNTAATARPRSGPAIPSSQGLLPGVLLRILLFALLIAAGLLGIRLWLETAGMMDARSGLPRPLYGWGIWVLRSGVVFSVVLLALTSIRARRALERLPADFGSTPIAWRYLAAHVAAMGAVAALSFHVYGSRSTGLDFALLVGVWLMVCAAAVALAARAILPTGLWSILLHASKSIWGYAALGGLAATPLALVCLSLWNPLTRLTFHAVRALLQLFFPRVIAIPGEMLLGTPTFQVTIYPQCSGLEGMALMLLFGIIWLGFFRSDYRFPQAFLLIPCGIVLVWLVNVVRIAALILIGTAGAPQVAVGGFHSEAGWIAFTAVALGFFTSSRRLPWFAVRAAPAESNPVAAYLVPFLLILAAGMIARAASSGSWEWLYPLRFVCAAAALWTYRRQYRQLDWRCGWAAPVVGGLVFLMWIGLDVLMPHPAGSGFASALAAEPPWPRAAWLVIRTLAAVTTVPIAEELAFRGFLLRRVVSADFESVRFRDCGYTALLISSLLFGILHGDRWVAATLAGIAYVSLVRRGRIGDAVVAHATTNALLATCVLALGRWDLW